VAFWRLLVCSLFLSMVGLANVGDARAASAFDANTASEAGDAGGQPPATPAAITIYLVSSIVHSDLVIPRSAFADAPPLLKSVVDRMEGGPWIIVGWGPYWFGRSVPGGPYSATPVMVAHETWSLVVPQLRSRVRVAAITAPGPAPLESVGSIVPIQLPTAGLASMLIRIDATFSRGHDGGPVMSDLKGAAPGVGIYRSNEFYHLTHECNHWIGEVLHAGGVNAAPFLDIAPGMVNLGVRMSGASGRATHPTDPSAAPPPRQAALEARDAH
jgi:hypothetical protein